MGCVMQAGAQSLNVGRNAVLAAGWPEEVPVHHRRPPVRLVAAGRPLRRPGRHGRRHDIVVAAGVEVMSQVPMGASIGDGKFGFPFGPRVNQRYADVGGLVPQGISAELIADKWGLTREELDAFAAESQRRAAQATAEGRFENEIVAVRSLHRDKETGAVSESDELVTADEGIREGTTVETLGQPQAGVQARRQGDGRQLQPDHRRRLRRAHHERGEGRRARAAPPGPLPHLRPGRRRPGDHADRPHPLHRQGAGASSGLSVDDIDLFEVNEAFASVVLAWQRETGADLAKVNVNGGAIALGHPLGCSGTKLLATLLNELERTGGRYGLQTMCEGGGMANATIIERLG